MNWSKAKNIIIVFLIAINIMLLIVSLHNNDRNVLTSEREKAIVKLLNQNGIEVASDIPPNYPSLPTISLTYKDNDSEELKKIFFGDADDVKRSVEFNSTVFKKDNDTLVLKDTSITYTNKDNKYNSNIKDMEQETAKKMADQFIKNKLSSRYYNYQFHSINAVYDKYYVITYYDYYGKYKLFSNYIKFYISGNIIDNIEIVKYDPTGAVGIDKEICSSDEALMTFMYECIESNDDKKEIYIDNIELGYILEEKTKKGENVRAIPCYLISEKGKEKVYYINAYTNTLIQ